MRTLFTDTDPLRAHRRRALSFAAVLVAALCVLALMLSSTAPAASLEEKRDSTQSKLNEVEASSSALADTIAAQNAEIDSMIGEVSALRQEAGRGPRRSSSPRKKNLKPRRWRWKRNANTWSKSAAS